MRPIAYKNPGSSISSSNDKYGHKNSELPTVIHVTYTYTVRKEIKCSGETEILHELVHDTTRISS